MGHPGGTARYTRRQSTRSGVIYTLERPPAVGFRKNCVIESLSATSGALSSKICSLPPLLHVGEAYSRLGALVVSAATRASWFALAGGGFPAGHRPLCDCSVRWSSRADCAPISQCWWRRDRGSRYLIPSRAKSAETLRRPSAVRLRHGLSARDDAPPAHNGRLGAPQGRTEIGTGRSNRLAYAVRTEVSFTVRTRRPGAQRGMAKP